MNLDRSTASANGSPGGVGYLSPSLSNGKSLKPGGIVSLRLPVVVVPNSVLSITSQRTYFISFRTI